MKITKRQLKQLIQEAIKETTLIQESVNGKGINRVYELLDEGLQKNELIEIIGKAIGSWKAEDITEYIKQTHDISDEDITIWDLEDILGEDVALDSILRALDDDTIWNALEDN